MKRPENDCGEDCRKLNERQHKFHLLVLQMALPDGPTSLDGCYISAGYSSKGTLGATSSSATRLHGNARVKAALAHHRGLESKKTSIDREYLASLLKPVAETLKVKTADLVTVRARPEVSAAELTALVEIESDGERAEALRHLLKVQLLPWEGEGAIDPELTRGVSVKQRPDGSVELVPPPMSAGNAAVAQLRALYDLDEKTDAAKALEALVVELGAVVRSTLGAEAAEKLTAKLAAMD